MTSSSDRKIELEQSSTSWIELVRREVSSLHYGKLEIRVEKGKAVEIERTDRTRFEKEYSTVPRV